MGTSTDRAAPVLLGRRGRWCVAVAALIGALLAGGCTTAPSSAVQSTAAANPVATPSTTPNASAGSQTPTRASPRSVPSSAPSAPPSTRSSATLTQPSTPLPNRPGPSAPSSVVPAPATLSIEAIGVDEELITLGVTADGAAEVPADYGRAGWFDGGGRPGTIGPTVILGHVDSKSGPAVFFRLAELVVGAQIRLGLADGSIATYQVSSVERFRKDDFPTFTVYGATVQDVLRLVTCGGEFDRSAGSYRDNIVVTAERLT